MKKIWVIISIVSILLVSLVFLYFSSVGSLSIIEEDIVWDDYNWHVTLNQGGSVSSGDSIGGSSSVSYNNGGDQVTIDGTASNYGSLNKGTHLQPQNSNQ